MADFSFFHGGLPDDFDFSTLDPLRLAKKQQKAGRNYAGFYMLDEGQLQGAEHYADMNKGAVHKITVSGDSRIKDISSIERLPQSYLKQLIDEGYDLVRGPNSLRKQEYVLLNPSKIVNSAVIRKAASALGKTLGPLGMVLDATNAYDMYNSIMPNINNFDT